MQLKEYDEEKLPLSTATLVDSNVFITKLTEEWVFSGEYPCNVLTYNKWIGPDYWAARVSDHPDMDYETMRNAILLDHTRQEVEYIHAAESFKELHVPPHLEGWESYVVHYHFPFPFFNRDMAIWITSGELEEDESFLVVTVPRNVHTSHIKGHYCSVEKVERLGTGVRWTMAQTSLAGGWIPKVLQRRFINKAIAADVPQFLRWIEDRK